jgi:hypothetical protein
VIDVAHLSARRNHQVIIFAHVNGQINRLASLVAIRFTSKPRKNSAGISP